MKLYITTLLIALVGCASPGPVPEKVEGVFCTSVDTLTAKVVTVVANKTEGVLTVTKDCDITSKK